MDQKVERENGQGIGALLRASRLRCGEELDDVAAILRIRRPYLEAIEEGRFADLPGATYAVGFIRAYAEHLGLDSTEVVRRFKSSEAQPTRGKPELVFPVPVAETGVPGGAIVFVGVLVAVVAYGAWYLSSTKDGFFAELVSPLPERLASLANQTPSASPPAGKESQPSSAIAATLPERRAETAPAPAAIETKPVEIAQLPDAAPAPVSAETPAEAKPAASPADATTPAEPIVAPNATPPAPAPESAKVENAEPAAAPVVTATAAAPATPTPEPAKIEKVAPAPADDSLAGAKPADEKPATAVAGNVESADKPAPAERSIAKIDEKPAEAAALPSSTRGIDAPYRPEAETVAALPAPVAKVIPKPETKPAAPVAATPAASRIVVRAKSNSWIQVRDDVDNQLLLTRLLRAGDTYPVPNRPGLMLLTGNAGALEIQVDGETVPGIGGGAVRRSVALDVERLRQGKAVVD